MLLLMCLWVLAMISGLIWASRWTVLLNALTVLVFLGVKGTHLAHWTGWLQLGVFVLTPWLLAAEQGRQRSTVRQLHATEADQLAKLSDSARSLLSLQDATKQLERQITHITDVYHVSKETARALHLVELFESTCWPPYRIMTNWAADAKNGIQADIRELIRA